MEKKEEPMYTCEVEMDASKTKRVVRYFPAKIYWSLINRATYFILIICIVLSLFAQNLLFLLFLFGGIEILVMIYYRVKLEEVVEKIYQNQLMNGKLDTHESIEFYENYLIRKNEKVSLHINYTEIGKVLEDDENFYLQDKKEKRVTLIPKDSCDKKLSSFIQEKFQDIEIVTEKKTHINKFEIFKDSGFINFFMFLLFILTILSLWGALESLTIVDKFIPQQGSDFTKNTWIFWCWLPIPILSILLGFKYNKVGLKCTKNIIAGFIMGFLLLTYGSFSLLPTFEADYSKLEEYKEIIDAKLPENGTLEIIELKTPLEEDKTNCTVINVHYNQEDVNEFVDSIKNSTNWILSNEVKSELKIFIPSNARSDGSSYYSIYNKTTKEYNTIPKESGKYEIYAMKYDVSNKHLIIYKYYYEYK